MSEGVQPAGAARPVRVVALLPLLLAACGVLAYSNSFSGAFLFDDAGVIARNWRVREFSARETVRPVAHLSFALNHALSGDHPADYHLANLAIHLAAGLLLYGLARRTLRLPRFRGRHARDAQGLAFAIAALWLVHPLQTQSVTYIAQRIESLMGLFYLLALYAIARGATGRPAAWHALAAVAGALAMATKQVAVTLPVVALLYDWIFLCAPGERPWRARPGLHAGLAAGWVVLGLLYRYNNGPAGPAEILATRWQYLATQFGVIVRYVRLACWPAGQCLDYAWPLAETPAAIVPAALAVGAAGLAALVALWRWPAAGFLGCAFFILLAPTSSIAPIADVIFEHRMYLPLAPLLALAVLGAQRLGDRLTRDRAPAARRALALVALGAVLVALGAATHDRNRDYRDELTMWLDVVGKRPDNARARLGAAEGLIAAGRYAEATAQCRAILAGLPDFRSLDAAAFPAQAATQAEAGLLRQRDEYGSANMMLGKALVQQGRGAAALPFYEEALRLKPDDAWGRSVYALTLYGLGREDEAIAQWEQARARADARSVTAGHIDAYLAHACLLRRRYAEALRHGEAALRLLPDQVPLLHDLARLLAAAPDDALRDGPRALRLALRVCEATDRRSARALDTLGTACAETGHFDEALEAVRQAQALLRDAPPGAEDADGALRAEDLAARRALYEAHRPFRLP